MKNYPYNYRLLGLAIVFVGAVGCAKSSDQAPVQGSAFVTGKVKIYDQGTEVNTSSVQKVSTINRGLLAIVDNICTEQLSDEERQSLLGEGIELDLSQQQSIRIQSYPITIAESMPIEELEARANKQKCVVGITNDEFVEIPDRPLTLHDKGISISGLNSYDHFEYMEMAEAKRTHFSSILDRGEPVSISVIDTGTTVSHQDLRDITKVEDTYDFTTDTELRDGHGHGTHVSGLAASMLDFNPNAVRMISAKALSKDGRGFSHSIFNSIIASVDKGADVINLSLSGILPNGFALYTEAFSYAVRNNAVVVVAAGNFGIPVGSYTDGPNSSGPWPAALGTMTGVINVASVDTTSGFKSGFSNHGRHVELAAPGCIDSSQRPFRALRSAGINGGYAAMCGTSMASPIIAGVAGLVIKHFRSQNKDVSPGLVEEILKDNTKFVTDNIQGQIDLVQLANSLKNNQIPTVPNYIPNDAHGHFVSKLYATFLGRPHNTNEVGILTRLVRDEKRSFEWLLLHMLNLNDVKLNNRTQATCDKALKPLYVGATGVRADTSIVRDWCYNFKPHGHIDPEDAVSFILASKEFHDHIEELGLSDHPLALTETGRSVSSAEFNLRKSLGSLAREILQRPAMVSDIKFTKNAGSVQAVRNAMLNSHDKYVSDTFINLLYQNAQTLYQKRLDGWTYWTGELEAGRQSRASFIGAINDSNERFVRHMIHLHARIEPYDWQVDFMIRDLNNGTKSREQVLNEIRNYNRTPTSGETYSSSTVELRTNEMYIDYLDRVETEAELDAVKRRVLPLSSKEAQDIELAKVRKEVQESDEGGVVKLFVQILNRGPSNKERKEFVLRRRGNESWDSIRADIEDLSPNPGSTPEPIPGDDDNDPSPGVDVREQVASLYREVLNREGDEGGIDYFTGEIAAGRMTLEHFRSILENSLEARIRQLYLVHLQREPDLGGRRYWAGEITSGRRTFEQVRDIFRRVRECKVDCL